jgi:hypothetical protein
MNTAMGYKAEPKSGTERRPMTIYLGDAFCRFRAASLADERLMIRAEDVGICDELSTRDISTELTLLD